MADRNKDLVARTKAHFSPLYRRELTEDEAIEIVENLRAFAEILIEIYEKDQIKLKKSAQLSQSGIDQMTFCHPSFGDQDSRTDSPLTTASIMGSKKRLSS